jgi:hypothetical protein
LLLKLQGRVSDRLWHQGTRSLMHLPR